MYAWQGKYFILDSVYIEDGINNDDEQEWNEAHIYYVPERDQLIYKGLRGIEGYDGFGSSVLAEFEGLDCFYYKRCSQH